MLVQVTKDPVGHKGARLTSHVALSGRHLVYVPNGNASGISRKLSDVERKRLRDILKKLVPEGAGVIVRTAAEGATEDELERDVKRLSAQWETSSPRSPPAARRSSSTRSRTWSSGSSGTCSTRTSASWSCRATTRTRWSRTTSATSRRTWSRACAGTPASSDVFAEHRIDEQILKGLDRKVFLPSGGSLVIDRTEAMTVVDVNTGKYTGTGGNLEETVTRNNLEAAEEIVRQLRLRDLGGIVVIDFIDMVLESNRELVLRRLTECLGRDRTKHQVTEITSLGLVQMTRKRIGQGLLEAFSETCEHCKGRGVIMHTGAGAGEAAHAARPRRGRQQPAASGAGRKRGRRGRGSSWHAAVAEADVRRPRTLTPTSTSRHMPSDDAGRLDEVDDESRPPSRGSTDEVEPIVATTPVEADRRRRRRGVQLADRCASADRANRRGAAAAADAGRTPETLRRCRVAEPARSRRRRRPRPRCAGRLSSTPPMHRPGAARRAGSPGGSAAAGTQRRPLAAAKRRSSRAGGCAP